MTTSHSLKMAVRERMTRTGEAYSTARRNIQSGTGSPRPRTPGTFTGSTDWYCDEWVVETQVHGFATPKDAANFAGGIGPDSADMLRLRAGALFILTSNGQEIPIPDSDIKVSKEKPGAKGKSVGSYDDFEEMSIRPQDFHTERGLSRGFESLAYGVRDHNGDSVDTKADPLESAPMRGDITSLLGLLRALNHPGAMIVQAPREPGQSMEDPDWMVDATGEIVDEGIFVLSIRGAAVQREGSAARFRISAEGQNVLRSLERAISSLPQALATSELNQGHSLLIFAPTGAGGLSLAETLTGPRSEILTPERLGFDGIRIPNAPPYPDLARFCVRRDLIGEFLSRAGERPGAPFVCVVQATGPEPQEAELDEIIKAGIQKGTWPKEELSQVCVLALSSGPSEPGTAWMKILPTLV